jgi:hypothetical protein
MKINQEILENLLEGNPLQSLSKEKQKSINNYLSSTAEIVVLLVLAKERSKQDTVSAKSLKELVEYCIKSYHIFINFPSSIIDTNRLTLYRTFLDAERYSEVAKLLIVDLSEIHNVISVMKRYNEGAYNV